MSEPHSHLRRTPGTAADERASATTAAQLAALAWLRTRALTAPALTPWHVEISLGIGQHEVALDFDEQRDTRFRIEIYAEEWGVYFCHRGRASWIRVRETPFVHRRDDFMLLAAIPALKDIGALLRVLEREHHMTFSRANACLRTNLMDAEPSIRQWIRGL